MLLSVYVSLIIIGIILSFSLLLLVRDETKHIIGQMGELVLHHYLKNKLDPKQYIFMHNIMLPTDDEMTTQIDHIVVSQWGIFVIETKTFAGHIYGTRNESNWTAKYNPRQKGFSFQNPLHQNYKHIATLSERLGLEPHYFKTIVAFSGKAKFGKEMPEEVMHFRDVPKYILSKSTEPLYPHQFIHDIVNAIYAWQDTLSSEKKSAHVENLHKKHSKPQAPDAPALTPTHVTMEPSENSSSPTPACPKCGIPMVMRTRKTDGQKFWACPNYPKCRCIVNIPN